jgi:hypothetical protein
MQSSPKDKLKSDSTSIRFGARVPLALEVRLSPDTGATGQGTLRNASISGALIETALDLPLHTNLVVTFSMPGEQTPPSHSLAACVMRIDPGGVGIEWCDMAGADVMDLLERATHPHAVD